MSYYDNQQWSTASQPSWEQQTPPARSGRSWELWMEMDIAY